MDENVAKQLLSDPDGMLIYEYIVNNIDTCLPDLDMLVDNLLQVDRDGRYVVSAARYLNSLGDEAYAPAVRRLVSAAIDKDRERRYLGDLLLSLYGEDYRDHVDELRASDDNFRRIYKRLHPTGLL